MTTALAAQLAESTEPDMFDLDARVVLSHDEIASSRYKSAETHLTACGTCPGLDC